MPIYLIISGRRLIFLRTFNLDILIATTKIMLTEGKKTDATVQHDGRTGLCTSFLHPPLISRAHSQTWQKK